MSSTPSSASRSASRTSSVASESATKTPSASESATAASIASESNSAAPAPAATAPTRAFCRSRMASTTNRSTPRTLAPMHTQAITSLVVTTAAIRATRAMTANTNAMMSVIGWPPATLSGVCLSRRAGAAPTGTAGTRRHRSRPELPSPAGRVPRAGIPGRSSVGCGTRARRCATAPADLQGPCAAD